MARFSEEEEVERAKPFQPNLLYSSTTSIGPGVMVEKGERRRRPHYNQRTYTHTHMGIGPKTEPPSFCI